MKIESYDTLHPTIKQITKGDIFITRGNYKVVFISLRYDKLFNFKDIQIYPEDSTFDPIVRDIVYNKFLRPFYVMDDLWDIKQKCIPLKDKIKLL